MSDDNNQDLQEFCICTLSYGNISLALLTRHFESFWPPVRPVPDHIAPTLATTTWAQDWVTAPLLRSRGTSLTEQWLTLVTPASQISNILRVFQAYHIAQCQTLAMRWIQGEIKHTLTSDVTVFLLSCPFTCLPTLGFMALTNICEIPIFLRDSQRNSWFCEHFASRHSTTFILGNVLLCVIVDTYHNDCPCEFNNRHLVIGNHNVDFCITNAFGIEQIVGHCYDVMCRTERLIISF